MVKNINIGRRGFLTYFSKALKKSPAISAQTVRVAPRPPQAVDELLFAQLCDGCGVCQQVCPNQIIEIVDQLAQINLGYNECSLCAACTKACSNGALHTTVSPHISLRPHFSYLCNNYQMIDCLQCQAGCSNSAIVIVEGELPHIIDGRCDGCGQCQKSCPLGAISMALIADA
ncbi:ferredoxin-type protein NapF (plasmid) [Vibrio sp. HDW18]|uniref:ferredoxin-type protein NapF n=1 Tax=Vibrio sp. HDW18 TaxID=2714948 RepID=UPI00140A5818|nr:ferredoxin-type protein NapF [Vibrio sp. HDW18]QIL86897.1 ferredoxin-type protein NapF [Vibrio sp. HDW18]